jgi:NAD-dependent deacetylase
MTADRRLVALLGSGKRILVFTGAGISTGSGIPDYRGPQGVWKRRQPVYYQEFMASEAARVEYWEFKLEAYAAFRDAEPNAAHFAVAELERADRIELVVTQNIDGLHLEAGSTKEKLVELHGTDREVECQGCGERGDPAPHFESFARTRRPPVCARCGGPLKPATISFGQQLRRDDLARAVAGAESADLVIALGSTLSVTPAADIPLIAAGRGVPYVVINRGETAHDDHPGVTLRLDGDVAEIFPPAVRAVCGGAAER